MKITGSVPAEYLPLHKYLDGRYADTVVLTFAEVEDIIGVGLPEAARTEQDWWANGGDGATASPQSHAWTRANRSARPNLRGQTVVFDRTSV